MRTFAFLASGLFVLSMFFSCNAFGAVLFVSADAAPSGDGQSWETAYRFLQDALSGVATGDEIWVAGGVYKPDQSEANPSGTGDRTASFVLKNGIRLIGGLAGTEDPQTFDLRQRDFERDETILSGDLNDDDNPLVTGAAMLNDPNRSENAYRVLKGTGITDATVIDGFTITGGHATGAGEDNRGGGLHNTNNSNPQLLNCLFTRNTAQWGAVLYNYRSSNRIDNCRFIDNASIASGTIHNGASLVEMYITNSVFENCFSEGKGGAIYNNNNALMRLEHCRLVNNKVWKYGNPSGGAISLENNSQLIAAFCTLAGNIAQNEGGGIHNKDSTVTLDHCILWDNEDSSGLSLAGQYHEINGTWSIDYTCIMGWNPSVPGTGNFGTDPLFANLAGGNVHLQSKAGRWDPQTQAWILDTQHSSCIDAGDPSLFIGEEPIGNGGRINIGVYAGTAHASRTDICTGGIDGKGRMLSDLNRDCRVNLHDIAWLASEWLTSTVQPLP